MQVDLVEPSYFDTDHRRQQFQKYKSEKVGEPQPSGEPNTGSISPAVRHYGTVGCVALDSHGNLAAGTSTGGTPNKQFGRVGDSPIIGAGTYADNATCAVSCTGHGEEYIRHAIAYDIAAQMRYAHRSLQQSVADAIENRLQPGDGGVIAVDQQGNIVMRYNTQAMARAAADSKGRFDIIWERAPRIDEDRNPAPIPAGEHGTRSPKSNVQ